MPVSSFNNNFARLNGFEGQFGGWEFGFGMAFMDSHKWWGDKGIRPGPHEGVDLRRFRLLDGRSYQVAAEMIFPSLLPGKAVTMFPDFLGETVIIRHDIQDANGWRLHSALGHTRPLAQVKKGERVLVGQPVVQAAAVGPNQAVGSHLHLSLMWAAEGYEAESYSWKEIAGSEKIVLIDPVEVLRL